MSTSQEHALKFYADGKPRIPGKTKAQAKKEAREAWKNRHNDPTYKGLSNYHIDTSNAPPNKEKWNATHMYGWAGRVGEAHRRNQKAEHEKGYREDYR